MITIGVGLHLDIWEKSLSAFFDFPPAFLYICNIFKKNMLEILNIASFFCLLYFVEVVGAFGDRGVLGAKFLCPCLELFIYLFDLFLLLFLDFIDSQLHVVNSKQIRSIIQFFKTNYENTNKLFIYQNSSDEDAG